MVHRSFLMIALAACAGGVPPDVDTDASAPPVDAPPGDGPSSGDVDAAPAVVDPCPPDPPACPVLPGGYGAGDGLRAIDRCAFPLDDRDTWAARGAIIDGFPASVPRVSLADVAGDLNRAAEPVTAAAVPGNAPGIRVSFTWQSGDQDVAYWIPQGLTGSFDAAEAGTVAGRTLLLVSWYYDRASEPGSTAEKGVRIAIVDVTDPRSIRYRFALLVEPVVRDGRSDFAPVAIHAGGLAWYRNFLYVPDTGNGFRVFDLSRILAVDTTQDRLGYDAATGVYHAHGYRYVIPQIATYLETGACEARFSFASIDRSTTPPSLVSGEYDDASVGGRLYRWPLDLVSGRLAITDRDRVVPDGAWFSGQSHIQGALSVDETWWLSSSAPTGGAGALYRTRLAATATTLGWLDTPEDLAHDPATSTVWSLSEGLGARYVIGVARTSVD